MAAVAEALYVSQSAVSKQISLLEEELGISLIERTGRVVTMTLAGQRLVERPESIIREIESARADIAELRSTISGEVRVAAFPSVAATVIPTVARHLCENHPNLTIQFEEMEPAESMAALRSWQTDVAIIDDLYVPKDAIDPNFETIFLMEDVFNVMVSKGHKLAERPTVRLGEIKDDRWALDTLSDAYTRMITNACKAAGTLQELRSDYRDGSGGL
ncbi:putative LysR family transcriptional regulator [Agrobacterium rubi TR3 = NBRC 13261]|uniref:Putative LysR family transcriptional regulator n=1 Tax=Agrobacterium rubi TR3 = NBRC 13261 TaxID=1368415 RepID=A0A081CVG9_9HYPH|nr:DNA-binding transcriptional LysR family regulator [Agrobacterium rubi]GAK70665.1 putative LysR family transcriptional regulator [Agrobacterium rubi TR3 = NBRC 13261]